MKIYTKTGDKGQTSLASGERILKNDPRADAYGTADETNSFVGLLRVKLTPQHVSELDPLLQDIQNELFVIGTHLASRDTKTFQPLPLSTNLISKLESEMDRMNESLPKLNNFILPGGAESASLAHVIRTVARRAERLAVAIHQSEPMNPGVIVFLNRLSDFFFVLARYLNHRLGHKDVIWTHS